MDTKEEEEDEISIDFSKIKNFFKSKDKEESKAEPSLAKEEEKEDGEMSIDFGKIKKFFKPDESGDAKPDDEISINWNKVFDFFKKYGVIFIALIPILLCIYIRIQTGSLLFTDDWASSTVINNIRSQVRAGIDKQYPNLPDANKNALVDRELQRILIQNKGQIDEQIKGTSVYFRSFFQDEKSNNYMPDIDPYYWFRYAKNIVDHGHPGDILKDGKPFDTYQLAPNGRFVVPDQFHPYFLAYFYRFLHFFAPDLTLMRSMFYYPVLVSALCVLLAFLIARKIAGNIGGFFAGMMMAVNAAFLSRTLSPDNDAWNIFFTLIVTWLILETLGEEKNIKVIAMSLLGGLFTGLFTVEWTGWWYIFDFLLGTIGLVFLYLVLTKIDKIKQNFMLIFSEPAIRNILIVGFLYFFSTAFFTTLFSGWGIFTNSFLGPLSFPSIKAPVSSTSLWPNVLTTVAELNEGSIDAIINSIGGRFLFFISLVGLLLAISRKEGIRKFDAYYIIGATVFYAILYVKLGAAPALYQSMGVTSLIIWIMLPILLRVAFSVYKKDSSYDFKLPILLSLWLVSTIFASIKGIRFTVLMAPAFSVAFGVALGKIYFYMSRLLSRELKIHKAIGSTILIVLLLLMYISPAKGSINSARYNIPIINDAWHSSLNAIKQDSSKNAIITSWWDFGHHFKAIADRRVTFDGTTQTSEAAHWVGKLLMSNDEKKAFGIIRMLDCGLNDAFNEIDRIGKNTHSSLKILDEIILLDKAQAEKSLGKHGFDSEQIISILKYSHCSPPDAYFIASEDMIGKSGVWSHFGSWNFERADIWQNARKLPQDKSVEYMMSKFNYTKEKAENTYFEIQSITTDSQANSWVAPWPGYGGTVNCGKNEKMGKSFYVCSNGFQVNLSNYDVFAVGQQGTVRPKLAAFTSKEGMFIKEFNGSNVDLGITIIPKSENELLGVLSSKELTGSMFTRMFYMQGHGLKYFKLFNHQHGLTGADIYDYKVDWEGKNTTIVPDYVNFFKDPEPVKEEISIKDAPIKDKNLTPIENLTLANDTNSDSKEANNSNDILPK